MLRLAVLGAGAATMALEIAAARLLAPSFGTALPVWASLIAAVLGCLAVGSWLGGRLSRRGDPAARAGAAIAVGGALVALAPVLAGPALSAGALALAGLDAAGLALSLGSAAVVVALPTIPLAAALPLAIAAETAREESGAGGRSAGREAGTLLALSTVGSIAGVLTSALVSVPWLGTRATFAAYGVAAVLAGAAVVAGRARSAAAAGTTAPTALAAVALAVGLVAGAVAAARPGPPASSPEVLASLRREGALHDGGDVRVLLARESAYHLVRVAAVGDARYLLLDEAAGVQSVFRPGAALAGGVWDDLLVAPLFAAPATPGEEPAVRRALVIGLAGGTVAHGLAATWRPAAVEGVEIDPVVARAAREHFALADVPGLTVAVADGRRYLAASRERYDLVVVDAFRGPYVPFHLTTAEFFRLAADHLTAAGVVAVNVPSAGRPGEVADAVAASLAEAVDDVVVVRRRDSYNAVLVGGRLDPAGFDARRALLPSGSPLRRAADRAADRWQVGRRVEGVAALTDDRAPVEWLTDRLIWREAAALP